MILNDVYLPHTRAELEALARDGNLDPELLGKLDPTEAHGIQWYSRNKWETDSEGRRIVTPRPREEWVAIPTPPMLAYPASTRRPPERPSETT